MTTQTNSPFTPAPYGRGAIMSPYAESCKMFVLVVLGLMFSENPNLYYGVSLIPQQDLTFISDISVLSRFFLIDFPGAAPCWDAICASPLRQAV